MAAISLQRQKIATTLVTQWNQSQDKDSFISTSAAEQMRPTSQLLRQAEVTKERTFRMGTRYLIMDLWHEDMTEWETFLVIRQVWLKRKRDYAFGPRAIIEMIKNQCELLNIAIEDMKATSRKETD
uniref:ELMO domain-containing protein n=1 Tax=Haemonchus contortus TaxID=6289 RepID=A0A7I4Z4Z7_HAECO